MAAPDSRISANKVGLVFVLLLAVWLVFTIFPRSEKPAPTVAPVAVESKLHAVGLEDNPDWEGLPEFFAIWADHAGWKDDKAQFAYWDQGSRSYSYFFEASRVDGKVRFRVIPEPKFIEGSGSSFAKTYVSETGTEMVAETDLKAESPEHPFVFFIPMPATRNKTKILNPLERGLSTNDKPKVKVDVRPAPMDLTKPERKDSTPDGR